MTHRQTYDKLFATSLTPEQHEDLLKGGPRALRTVDDFGDANPRGHGKFHGRSRQPITLQNDNPRGSRRGLSSPLLP